MWKMHSIARVAAPRRVLTRCHSKRFEVSVTARSRGIITSAKPPRLILGIETSCDDSCASVVSSDRNILSDIVTKQDHSTTGGIHPLSAALGHHANIAPTIAAAIDQAQIAASDLDAIAVTQGPGMASSLGVGLSAAKTLSAVLRKPLIYVHHMQAHALTPLLTEADPPQFPFLVLLVSGGHTMLVLARSVTDFEILATTSDDSIGDAFDKVARDLGIPWTSAPGAALETLAAEAEATDNQQIFPVPRRGQPGFSYSGLKAAVQRHIESQQTDGKMATSKALIAAAFQRAACAQLEDKLGMVLRPSHHEQDARRRPYSRIKLPDGVNGDDIKTVVCSGGVASNAFIRARLREHLDDLGRQDVDLQFPPLPLCTDNAAMIAWTGHLIFEQCTKDYTRHARPKWSMEDIPR
ncbi:O-sialoglycoprotein endopeptidase [Pseudozyma hubeiensis SY62]|uniref:N(6)-L-threonylcarbamoyladenine synthase n=1 Tax=Pseudozyma hubeiensis (strain SY62) TaxID=1305764 RepID=R9PDR5_PSEHS|nr:O-sialoglycoprotein endopeptidase [Pseudozyma hubeiensis SY62]GAC99362.1 O-sialoglycoprotein endopeptidase [Pseudozyma hubeiensis SY62]